jgi:hypothetical protein
MLADVNAALGDVITNSKETAIPNALLLPTTRFPRRQQHPAVEHRRLGAEVPADQQQLFGDDRAGSRHPPEPRAGDRRRVGTRRMVAYEKSPDNVEFFLPGMYEFLPPFPISSMSWRVDGIMNVGQLEIYRPKAFSYRDNI